MAVTRQLFAALKALLVLTVLLGVLYPAAILAVGLVLPGQAKGSLIEVDGKVVGSSLLGQAAEGPQWFQARPSVSDQSGDTSGGSNLGPSSEELASTVAEREAALREANPDAPTAIPADALTASGSGLDPHISPGVRRLPGAAGRRGARDVARAGAGVHRRPHPEGGARLHRPGPGQRDRAECRARDSGRGRIRGSVRMTPWRRGRLRIYLGAAPGVGKTVAMLDEGRRRMARGTDVVVGLVETHGREHTAEMVAGLEVLPRTRLEHRGASFEEMDLDGLLTRRPSVALVDELAHTNVPGSRHEKRWQDIDELLDAGIDVISTVNIQHLESLNDVVESITGVVQRETVPDEVVRRADQIELVDMSPEALRRRMAHGNIYKAEKVDAALANYFRVGNLSALRELALLWLADRVEEGLGRYRADHGIDSTWPTRERVVVALSGGPGGRDAAAARCSNRLARCRRRADRPPRGTVRRAERAAPAHPGNPAAPHRRAGWLVAHGHGGGPGRGDPRRGPWRERLAGRHRQHQAPAVAHARGAEHHRGGHHPLR